MTPARRARSIPILMADVVASLPEGWSQSPALTRSLAELFDRIGPISEELAPARIASEMGRHEWRPGSGLSDSRARWGACSCGAGPLWGRRAWESHLATAIRDTIDKAAASRQP